MRAILARPSTAFFLLAGVVVLWGLASRGLGAAEPMIDYLPIIASITGVYGGSWLLFELAARSRARLWLGWLSFALQAASAALAMLGQIWLAGAMNTEPAFQEGIQRDVPLALLGISAMTYGGYFAAMSLAPILPAIVLAVFLPRRAQQA
jgi:hypothetical protein